jgi:hypothetical protein
MISQWHVSVFVQDFYLCCLSLTFEEWRLHFSPESFVFPSRAHPLFFLGGGGGADTEAIYNLYVILKIML